MGKKKIKAEKPLGNARTCRQAAITHFNLDAKGLSKNTGELLSLEQAGVANLKVAYTNGSTTDAQGNQHLQLGTYTTTSGATRKMDDVWFATDSARTQDHETVAVSATIAALPELAGMGNVRSLRQTDEVTPFSDRMAA